ncbi:MAG: DUF58 domain-containing protein [Eubacterium sp.]|nr:DUF58 domain-containing protein [Eubacterium sp.]
MLSIIVGIVLTGAAFYISVLYKSSSMVVLGYASAVLLVMACVFLAWRVHTLQCSVTFPIAIAECGKPLSVRIVLENRSFLPCLRFQCQVELGNRFLKKRKKRWLRGAVAQSGTNSYDYPLVIEDYGSYELRLKKVRVYDLTGLFYVQKTVESSGVVQVLPKMQEIGVHVTEAARNFIGDADVYDDYRAGDDHSELFQVRQFHNGDKIQSVHWKLSARLGELLVREDSLPKACPVVFLLRYADGKQKNAESVNAYLVILASISFSMMDSGCPHYAAWYSSRQNDVVRVRVDDEESLYLFLSCYLEETNQEQKTGLADAYREKYQGENYLHLLELDGQLRLLKNGEQITAFETAGWREKLSGLELVL